MMIHRLHSLFCAPIGRFLRLPLNWQFSSFAFAAIATFAILSPRLAFANVAAVAPSAPSKQSKTNTKEKAPEKLNEKSAEKTSEKRSTHKNDHKSFVAKTNSLPLAISAAVPQDPSFDLSEKGPLFPSADLLARSLKDNDSNFSQNSLEQLSSVADFAQTYPDYYFRLAKDNEASLASVQKLTSFSAWCPGRAFPESFGALIRGDAASIFSVFDVESAGRCPIALSFTQLLVGASFYDSQLRVDLMIKSYLRGIQGDEFAIPHLAEDLMIRSRSKGMIPDESRVYNGHLLREPNALEVAERERKIIQTNLDQFFPRKVTILDVLKTRWESSLGEGRNKFSLLLESRGQILVVELIEETPEASRAFSSGEATSLSDRLTTAFTIERGGLSIYEGGVQISGVKYVMMPNFSGDLRVQLEPTLSNPDPNLIPMPMPMPIDLKQIGTSKNFNVATADSAHVADNGREIMLGEASEVSELLQFEAYTLGQIHARTLNQPLAYVKAWTSIRAADLARDVQALNLFYGRKFSLLQTGLARSSGSVANATSVLPVSP